MNVDTETEQDVVAIDRMVNPLCVGCYEGAWEWAARGNAGLSGCGCPTLPRGLDEAETRAEAMRRIIDALEQLDRLAHPLGCSCLSCEAALILRRAS